MPEDLERGDEFPPIVVYANVDMSASPNGFAGVYDEPNSAVGSSTASGLLSAAVARNGGTPIEVELHGGSDHYGFAEAGVATAGVFSGSLSPVSVEQAAASGSEAGRPADFRTEGGQSRSPSANCPIWQSPKP